MKKRIFVALAALAIAGATLPAKAAPEPQTYPAALIIIKAVHTPDWSGFIDCMRLSDYQRMNEGKWYHQTTWRINEDPEDLAAGDIIAVIMEESGEPGMFDDIIIDFKYAGYY